MRVVIAGGPRVGKTTLSRRLSLDYECALGTDDFIPHTQWGDVPDACIKVLQEHESWLLEGVNALRVLRRWIRDRGDCPKIDVCYYLTRPMATRTPKHWSMAKAIQKHWLDVEPKLREMGTHIELEVPHAE